MIQWKDRFRVQSIWTGTGENTLDFKTTISPEPELGCTVATTSGSGQGGRVEKQQQVTDLPSDPYYPLAIQYCSTLVLRITIIRAVYPKTVGDEVY